MQNLLSNERTTGLSIDPQYYPQIIGVKGKKLEEVRSKFHNIQITFPEANGKSDKVILHGDKEDVEKCSKFLQQKIKDLYSIEIELSKRLYPLLIGKSGSNIQRLREQMPDVRIDISNVDDTKEYLSIRLNGKRIDVDKARKYLDEHIKQLSISLENSIDQYITINPKWHNKFFQNKRKLLNELQQQYGDMLIKFPERNNNSDQVLLRGSKQIIEQVQKCLVELIDTWENTITKEISIPHRHHGYLLAKGGSYIQPIQKEYNVQIKFPPRNNHNEQEPSNDDIVRITGRIDDIEKAEIALEKMIPLELAVDIPFEVHGVLLGKAGNQLEKLIEQYPDVQITFPSLNSSSNLIHLKGQSEQTESVKNELIQRYEKYQIDKQARSYELRFPIKSEYRSLIIGPRRRTINDLKQKYNVNIQILNNQQPTTAVVPTPTLSNDTNHDDQQALPIENSSLTNETISNDIEILIIGYEDKALKCRDEILKLIQDFKSTITMEIDIDHRIHARIIGTGGQKLQQIMKDHNVDIKFPSNNQSNKVHVIGTNQDNIDACIDHLLILEEDFLQDLPYKKQIQNESSTSGQQLSNVQHRQQEVPSASALASNSNMNKSTKNNNKQAAFKVKNAPWASNEQNGFENQQEKIRNERKNSPKKGQFAPSKDDLGEYPSFSNGLTLTTDDDLSEIHETTVNTIPIIWGPPKRNK
ncbi:unnamed protein product [Rotaria sp. Silwood2]|nr:unnamed protein product [Rotaria sp. Silwood2]